MRIMTLDTATAAATVCLFHNGVLLARKASARRRADDVLKLIDTALEQQKLKPDELHLLVVRRGRGSYTGLRVGVAIANALAWSWQIPLLAAESRRERPLTATEWLTWLARQQVPDQTVSTTAWPRIVPRYQPWPGTNGSGKLKVP